MQSMSKSLYFVRASNTISDADTDKRDRIGCCVGALVVFVFGEILGRKKCIYVGAVIMFIGAALQASAFGVTQMLVGRIVW